MRKVLNFWRGHGWYNDDDRSGARDHAMHDQSCWWALRRYLYHNKHNPAAATGAAVASDPQCGWRLFSARL